MTHSLCSSLSLLEIMANQGEGEMALPGKMALHQGILGPPTKYTSLEQQIGQN